MWLLLSLGIITVLYFKGRVARVLARQYVMELINSLKSTSFQNMETSNSTSFSALGTDCKTSVLFLPMSNRMEFINSCTTVQTLLVPFLTAQIRGRDKCTLYQTCS